MRNLRQYTFKQLFKLNDEQAAKLDILVNKAEYKQEEELDRKIELAT